MIIYQTNDNHDDYIEINGIKVPRALKFPSGDLVSCDIIGNKAIYKDKYTEVVFDSSNFELQVRDDNLPYKIYIKKDTKIITNKQMKHISQMLWQSTDIQKIADPHSNFLVNLKAGSVVVIAEDNTEIIFLAEIDYVMFLDPNGDRILKSWLTEEGKNLYFSLNGKTDLNPVIPLIKGKNYEAVKEFFDNKFILYLENKEIVLDNHSFFHNGKSFKVNVDLQINTDLGHHYLIQLFSSENNVYHIRLWVDKNNHTIGKINQDVNITDIPKDITTEQLIQWIDLYESKTNV